MDEDRTEGMTPTGAIVALAGSVLLAFVFYYVVGFPANVPIALGSAVVVVELVEVGAGRQAASLRAVGKALFHGCIAAFAGWLGVVLAGLVHLA